MKDDMEEAGFSRLWLGKLIYGRALDPPSNPINKEKERKKGRKEERKEEKKEFLGDRHKKPSKRL